MGHPSLQNQTPFALKLLALADEELRPLLVLVAKATYVIQRDGLMLAEAQAPVDLSGQYWGTPETSSYRYEPECAFFKPATDVVLVGHAWAPERGTRELRVSLRVGPVRKSVRVVGERVWFKSLGSISMTQPLPFERLPLVYERAFGGWDRSGAEQGRHSFEPRNPVGVGFRSSPRHFEEALPLPNLEDPDHPLERFGQQVPPAGFGFLSPHWQPRAAFAGTYDEAWDRQRKPLLPRNFDRRFFNAASPGLVAPGFLRGGEEVVLVHASPLGPLSFRLPHVTPRATVKLAGNELARPEFHLDTVILDTDEHRLFLLWRGHVPLADGLDDVCAVELQAEGVTGAGSRVRL
ncbi:DUF2169 domain-containing protein [Corallococcus sicarius]|uniref:DUF2169 domain-containing protein n=1 Tax=Corallococcus sicarius TaxID=2316726 RepID=A0A3A8MTT6_9BACT|nr:DUF2169 domain-containing protein [Corallococcus sicarius]